MISHLHIENIAVIESADVFFHRGFNVLTGETGSGKSVIISAINAIFGGRVNKDMIRDGCEKFSVSVLIDEIGSEEEKFINELGYKLDNGSLLIYREFNLNGKNTCKVNARPATVGILKEIGSQLIDIYSQHEGYRLLFGDNHIKYLDAFGKIDGLEEYRNCYFEMKKLKETLDGFSLDEFEIKRKTELLKYQIDEIENADIKRGEIEKLNEIKKKYDNQKKIILLFSEINRLFKGDDRNFGILEDFQSALSASNEISLYINEINALVQRMQNLFYEISECFSDLNLFFQEFEYDQGASKEVEERLDVLYKLSLKYGKNEEDILNFLDSAKKELFDLQNYESKFEEISDELKKASENVYKIADEISKKRKYAGEEFALKLQKELKFLNMPFVKFKVMQEKTQANLNGCDKVRFLISINEGEPLKPMENIASGGEISRIMLAIKNIISNYDSNTVIFDEIDTGVSGNAASKIGLKLKELSKSRQVICITHLSQIASLGDKHLFVEKKSKNGRTYSFVKELNLEDRKRELARIMSGKVSELSIKAAQEMLNSNKEILGE